MPRILARLGTVAALACLVPVISNAQDAARLTAQEWQVESLKTAGVLLDTRLTLRVEEAGGAYGSAGCNRFTGRAMIKGQALSFSPFGTTRRACTPAVMDQERDYIAALEQTRGFKFEQGALILTAADGAALVRLTPAR